MIAVLGYVQIGALHILTQKLKSAVNWALQENHISVLPVWSHINNVYFNLYLYMFFQFGHMLQHVLSNVTYAEVSGLNNVEWDAVGICSNFMTHW